ncbi:TonB-linked SusC/RagA family outer membrane protein [Pedobacter africanus]|uniref:TonB-linked SusC/RagA family outer membrane protein n=1 Tax=Pedobacter africanus TaxID=151894 RepID=A0ACC6KUU5_9SPHI|nr:TonB-dependent receptor [Pedobacter africanus]MDR6783133.1 TonB-linked SusC/RagA family outer membrane protein [Pedobacter africanus]
MYFINTSNGMDKPWLGSYFKLFKGIYKPSFLVNATTRGRIIMRMNLIAILITMSLMQAAASSFGQYVTLRRKDADLKEVLNIIKKQTNYTFLYNSSLLKNAKTVSVNLDKVTLEEALNACLENQDLSFKIIENTVLLKKKEAGFMDKVINYFNAIDVRGKVLDEDGLPLPGATVMVKNSKKTVLTNISGEFELKGIDEKAILVVSFVGYTSKEVPVGSAANLVIRLQPNPSELTEVQVSVGYGAVKKRDLTGSVSLVDVGEMQKQPAFSLDVALAGRAPGVMVVKSSGAPGADASIRIRGASSVFGVNEPLYVIDGVPIQIGLGNGVEAYRATKSYQISPLASINPEDIERIDILKDASGTAIYGSRGANGVVLVTTKRGKGKPTLTLSYQGMTDRFVKDFDMLSSDEFFQVATQAYNNAGVTFPNNFIQNKGVSTDWRKLATRNSYSNMLNLALRGGLGNGQTNYAFSASMNNQAGVIKASNIDRYNIRGNIESEIVKSVKAGANINYAKSISNGSSSTFYYNIASYRPDIPVFDGNGRYATAIDSTGGNPVARTHYIDELTGDNLMASMFAEARPFEFLRLRSTLSYNQTDNVTVTYTPSYDPFEMKNKRTGSRKDFSYKFSSMIFDNTATFDKFFGKHYLNAMVGAAFTTDRLNNMSLESVNFPDDNVLNNLGSAQSIQSYKSNGTLTGLQSYFARTNYNYNGRYYFTFTARTDKSTKFGPNNQWGFFPSAAVAWRLSEESFLKNYKWISDLKIRVSTGKTGSANLNDNMYRTLFGTDGNFIFHNGQTGVVPNSVPNPSARWESTNQTDMGVDFAFLNNRIRGSVDVYRKYTKDLLLTVPVPFETGATSLMVNVGDISNKGFEFVIGADVITQGKFKYTTDINFNKNIGRLEKLNSGSSNALNRFKEGDLLGTIFGYKTAGLFQTQAEITALNQASPNNSTYQSVKTAPGDLKFVDANGDGFISDKDVVKLGSAEPKFFGGWNHVLRYEGLEASFLFYFSYGQKLQNGAKASAGIYNTDKNYYRSVLNGWTEDNKNTNQPRNVYRDPNQNGRISDYFVENGSFLKLKNVQLAYYINPAKWMKQQVNQIKLYAGVTNLFILTGYDGADPENGSSSGAGLLAGGYDSGIYPSTRTINFGFNITF